MVSEPVDPAVHVFHHLTLNDRVLVVEIWVEPADQQLQTWPQDRVEGFLHGEQNLFSDTSDVGTRVIPCFNDKVH